MKRPSDSGTRARPQHIAERDSYSQRRVTAERLRKAREVAECRFRTLAEYSAVGVVIVDGRGEVVECNDRAAAVLGMRSEVLLASNLRDLRKRGFDELTTDEGAPDHTEPRRVVGYLLAPSGRAGRVSVGITGLTETMYILRGESHAPHPDASEVSIRCARCEKSDGHRQVVAQDGR